MASGFFHSATADLGSGTLGSGALDCNAGSGETAGTGATVVADGVVADGGTDCIEGNSTAGRVVSAPLEEATSVAEGFIVDDEGDPQPINDEKKNSTAIEANAYSKEERRTNKCVMMAFRGYDFVARPIEKKLLRNRPNGEPPLGVRILIGVRKAKWFSIG